MARVESLGIEPISASLAKQYRCVRKYHEVSTLLSQHHNMQDGNYALCMYEGMAQYHDNLFTLKPEPEPANTTMVATFTYL